MRPPGTVIDRFGCDEHLHPDAPRIRGTGSVWPAVTAKLAPGIIFTSMLKSAKPSPPYPLGTAWWISANSAACALGLDVQRRVLDCTLDCMEGLNL